MILKKKATFTNACFLKFFIISFHFILFFSKPRVQILQWLPYRKFIELLEDRCAIKWRRSRGITGGISPSSIVSLFESVSETSEHEIPIRRWRARVPSVRAETRGSVFPRTCVSNASLQPLARRARQKAAAQRARSYIF